MGLLPENSLLPATANRNMLAQALKARQTTPRNQLTGQGLLDVAASGLGPIPIVGDALGLAADASRFYNEPESRTPLNFGLAALGAIPFLPPLVSMGLGKLAQSQGKTLGQLPTGPARNQAGAIVYHGSPHKFDQFDSSKIGTGEGAQAYGHGLYFAESPDVGSQYARMNLTGPANVAHVAGRDGGDALAALKAVYPDMPKQWYESAILKSKEAGNLYKVDLPDEAIAKMLDYDAPLSKQPEAVKKALLMSNDKFIAQAINEQPVPVNGGEYWKYLGNTYNSKAEALDDAAALNIVSGRTNIAKSPQELSLKLNQLGIPGIKYLDGGSRNAGKGASNYVVFPGNESLLKILNRE